LEDPAICFFAAEEYGNEDRNWGTGAARSKVRNCYFNLLAPELFFKC